MHVVFRMGPCKHAAKLFLRMLVQASKAVLLMLFLPADAARLTAMESSYNSAAAGKAAAEEQLTKERVEWQVSGNSASLQQFVVGCTLRNNDKDVNKGKDGQGPGKHIAQ